MPIPEDVTVDVIVALKKQDGSPMPLADASVLRLEFRAPDKSVTTVTATLHTDGSDGKIKYRGKFKPFGSWRVQGYVEKPSYVGRTLGWGVLSVYANANSE